MKIRKASSSLSIVIIFLSTLFCQENALVNRDQTAFLLGMFNDYMGKYYVPDHKKKSTLVTSFFSSEEKVAEIFIDSLKSFHKNDALNIFVERKDGIEIYSDKLSTFFNSYYIFEKVEDIIYSEENADEVEYDIYIGRIDIKKFKTKKAKLNFLLGAFIRYGEVLNNGDYKYIFANSIGHYEAVKYFLFDTNSEIIASDIESDNTPVSKTIVFKPSEKLKLMIGNYNSIQN